MSEDVLGVGVGEVVTTVGWRVEWDFGGEIGQIDVYNEEGNLQYRISGNGLNKRRLRREIASIERVRGSHLVQRRFC